MPLEQRIPALSEEALAELHKRTIGCIGALKEALLRAYQTALLDGETMDEKLILKHAPHNNSATWMARDAFAGEALLVDSKFEDLERVFAREAPPIDPPKKKASNGEGRGARRIGERNPSRDPVRGGPNA